MEKTYNNIEIMAALIPILEEEYVRDNELAKRELSKGSTSTIRPKYYENGERVIGTPDPSKGEIGYDEVWDKDGFRRDHFAGREYRVNPKEIVIDIKAGFSDERVFGAENYCDKAEYQHKNGLPDGIALACRIWKALGYKRGTNNLGDNSFFPLPSLLAESTYIQPPEDAQWLPKQFQSEQSLDRLGEHCPKATAYIHEMLVNTTDPFLGNENLLEKVSKKQPLNQGEFDKFLECASNSIKKRPWKIPLEDGQNMTLEEWNNAVAKHQEVVDELTEKSKSGGAGAQAAEYAKWTMYNGLRVNHWAFTTGNLDDTLLLNIIEGNKVVARAGYKNPETDEFVLTSFKDPNTGIELGGLFQAGIAAPKTYEIFKAPAGGKDYQAEIEGPFVEYIERPLIKNKETEKFEHINKAFLPGNALQVFQSTMPNTRKVEGWVERHEKMLEQNPQHLFEIALEKGLLKSAEALLSKRIVRLNKEEINSIKDKYKNINRDDVFNLVDKFLKLAVSSD